MAAPDQSPMCTGALADKSELCSSTWNAQLDDGTTPSYTLVANMLSAYNLPFARVPLTPDKLWALVLQSAAQAPLALSFAYFGWLLARRDLPCLLMILGQGVSGTLCEFLKHAIQEPRPHLVIKGDYGMPSGHSNFMAYFTVFSLLNLYGRVHFHDNRWKHMLAGVLLLFTAVVAYSRIALRFHTVNQVLAGLLLGTSVALVYYFFIHYIVRPLGILDALMNHPLAEYVYLKDFCDNVPYIMEKEYLHHKTFSQGYLKSDKIH
ncbi:Dolichyldiphosphatase 1 [Dispira simplex]|nr:Dolichyldiphosphatase 1 [Dispira simplex]